MGTPATVTTKTVTLNQSSPGAIKNLRAQIQAASQGLDSGEALNLTGRALGTLQDDIYTLQKNLKNVVAQINSGGGGSSTGGSANIQEVAAVHTGVTTITPTVTAAVDDILYVFITQDSSGNGLIAWNSAFRFAVTNIDPTANTISVFSFVGRMDSDATVRWFMTCFPLTGQPPLSQI